MRRKKEEKGLDTLINIKIHSKKGLAMSNNKENLQVGHKNGCYTVIAGFEAYRNEVAPINVQKCLEDKERFIKGEETLWYRFASLENFDSYIEGERKKKFYKVRCKCGREFYEVERVINFKKWRECGEHCTLKLQRDEKIVASYPRKKHESYDIRPIYNTHESLQIIECIDENFEGPPTVFHKGRYGKGEVKVYKLYRCKCHLCDREYEFRSDVFEIRCDLYGPKAKDGYYSEAYCDCHKISSFQWRTIKILTEHNVHYKVEVSFNDLVSAKGNLLRYDFAIFNEDETIKCLIECQGEQHYRHVEEFGDHSKYEITKEHDIKKKEYANKMNIPLVEIPYTIDTYEKEEKFLQQQGLI